MPKTPGEMWTALSYGFMTCKRPEDPDESFSKEAEEANIVLLNRVFNKLMQQMWLILIDFQHPEDIEPCP